MRSTNAIKNIEISHSMQWRSSKMCAIYFANRSNDQIFHPVSQGRHGCPITAVSFRRDALPWVKVKTAALLIMMSIHCSKFWHVFRNLSLDVAFFYGKLCKSGNMEAVVAINSVKSFLASSCWLFYVVIFFGRPSIFIDHYNLREGLRRNLIEWCLLFSIVGEIEL